MGIPDFPTALGLAAAIKSKEVSPSEVLEETLRRVDALDPTVNAVCWRDDEEARTRAKALDDAVASTPAADLPPFCGVPMPIKDLTAVAGWPLTYGSEGAPDDPKPESDLVVEAFERGGFLLAGRTNTPEFGPITAAENIRYGITRNPWNPDHTPGGSSGGAAAAVAAGMYAAAHANDGGGSIRIPASCCGLVGLKPSRGRVPVLAQSWEGASVEGVVTHTVADTAAILDVISEPDRLGWWPSPARPRSFADEASEAGRAGQGPLRVAVVTEAPLFGAVAPTCAAAVAATVSALEGAGHTVVDAEPDFAIDEFVANFLNVVNAGLASHDGEVDWSKTDAHIQQNLAAARGVDSIAYSKSVVALQAWSRKVNAQWGRDFDVLVTPTMAIEPPRAGQILDEVHADPTAPSATVFQMVLFTAVFNMNGLPALSLPVHQSTESGLPVGVQLVAGPWEEALLLRLGSHLEAALPWADRHPDLAALAGG